MNTTARFATALSLVAAAAAVQAQNAPFAAGPRHPMKAPLAPGDKDARLYARHRNVPPMPEPKGSLNGVADPSVARDGVGFDLATRRERVQPASRDFAPTTTSRGMFGSVPETRTSAKKGDFTAQTVFGPDDRLNVSNVTAYPFRTNGKLYMTFPNGSRWVGSATLVNGKYAITCGHCVYSAANGGWATSIEFVPGLYNSYRPYGSAYATYFRTYKGWTNNGDRNYDMALITLDRSIGSSTGWQGYAYQPNLTNWGVAFGGYDADKLGGVVQQWRSGPVSSDAGLGFYYFIDMKGGSSGSGVYYSNSAGPYVVGVNGWESSSWNFATKITSDRFNDIKGWIASGY